MDRTNLRQLLEQIQNGTVSVEQGLNTLKDFPYSDLGFARIDTHRALRQGFPEVVFAQNKTIDHLQGIVERLMKNHNNLLLTRVAPESAAAILQHYPDLEYNPLARTLSLYRDTFDRGRGTILVTCAGTSDLPVAEEAAVTARIMGNRVQRLTDVGVAGLHRLLASNELLQSAQVHIVVAGMEGALPSVVGGMVEKPVIAVPTSVGYGANFGGLSALLGMLNSCAFNVTVVNIDNGFGAGAVAGLINRK